MNRVPSLDTFLKNLDMAACGVLVKCKGKVLIVQEPDGKYSLPKGGQELGETHMDTALRELTEETGLELEPDDLSPEKIINRGKRTPFCYFEVEYGIEPEVIAGMEIQWSGFMEPEKAIELLPYHQGLAVKDSFGV